MSGKQLRAYIELSLAMVFVGSTVVVSKVITASFPVFLAVALRFAIAAAILLPMLLKAEHGLPTLGKKDICILFLQAFAGNFLFSILLLYGLRLTSAAESGIILGTVPVVIGLISFLLLGEPLSWYKGSGMLIATIGIVALNTIGAVPAGAETFPLLGNILVFGAVLGEALWTILGKAISGRVTPLTIASLTAAFGLVLFFPFAVYEARSFDIAAVPLLSWTPIVYYGIGTVGAYVLWYRGVSKVPASTAGVFSGVLPVSAVVLSSVLLKEPVLWSYWVGIACVLLAIILMTRDAPGRKKEDGA